MNVIATQMNTYQQ